MGITKTLLIDEMNKQLEESFECASCSDMVPLDIDEYENLAELKDHVKQLEKQFALCDYCKDREESL